MSPREQKIAMRSRVNERLAVMSDQERSLASVDLCARLADCTHELDGFIFAFIPMAMEVDIRPFLQNRLPGNMAVPLVDWDNRTMEPCRLHGLTDAELTRDRHGLRTPVRIDRVDPDEIDAIIIPAVAFDEEGFRLGRGGGYYDRFIEAMARRATLIGVAFDQQMVSKVPIEPWDQNVDTIVTPTRTIRVSRPED